ncbi:MAG: hypothetical protein V4582_09340 [Pseudomonadota bacterium]
MRAILLAMMLAWLVGGAQQAQAAPKPFEPDSLGQMVAAHKGKPFVLIVWSLDCEFCQASLAVLAKEKLTHPALRLVTLSTDAQGDAQTDAAVEDRLRSLGLNAEAWAFGGAPPEQLRYAIDPKWQGEMPRSYWFDAQGKSVAYSGVLSAATIARLSRK